MTELRSATKEWLLKETKLLKWTHIWLKSSCNLLRYRLSMVEVAICWNLELKEEEPKQKLRLTSRFRKLLQKAWSKQLKSFRRSLSNTRKKEILIQPSLPRSRTSLRKLTSWREIFNSCRPMLRRDKNQSKLFKICSLKEF